MDGASDVASRWTVSEDEITFRFVASGGPGGQHANRSNTKVEATFDVQESASMPAWLKERVTDKLGDTIRVTVDDERSQYRNRQLALERIQERVDRAAKVDRPRRKTKPTRGSQRRRLDSKRRRGDVKKGRRRPSADD
ncbi:MAG: aminoacyl-tRNA hydrolase [Acidimicrobiales bacterium]|nr:MAG: aminoacyl-tRNA hydrolase [Acidimicrobiales bacterium]